VSLAPPPAPCLLIDTTNPEVQAHLVALFQQLRAAGFGYFKLDFLTAGIRRGRRHSRGCTRLEAYRAGLRCSASTSRRVLRACPKCGG
jgi:hypothetical protein